MSDQIAVFVDGDNVSAEYAAQIQNVSSTLGTSITRRVYGDVVRMPLWQKQPDFCLIHSGTGKNATDILIAVDAMEFALTRGVKKVLIVSSDGDYRHVAHRLREHGLLVTGAGMKNASPLFKSACTNFVELKCQETVSADTSSDCSTEAPSCLEQQIHEAIVESGSSRDGIRLSELNSIMRRRYDIKISETPEKNWRRYLCNRAHLFVVEPPGKDAKVRANFNALHAAQ